MSNKENDKILEDAWYNQNVMDNRVPSQSEQAEFYHEAEIGQAKSLLEREGYIVKRPTEGVRFVKGYGIV